MSFLWGHWYLCFGLLVMSALGFKARVDSLACFLACALFLRFTSGATPADLLAAEPLWPTYLQPSDISISIGCVEVGAAARTYGLGQGSNPWPTVPQHSALNHSTIPARLVGYSSCPCCEQILHRWHGIEVSHRDSERAGSLWIYAWNFMGP